MKFLADENIPFQSVIQLRKADFDIISISEVIPGASDEQVINLANKENRIIISFDQDFGRYIYHKGYEIKTGVVLLRFNPANPFKPANVVVEIYKSGNITFNGFLTVIKDDYIRQKPL